MIGYIVEVFNLGSIDGQVGIGNLSCGDDSAIMCQAMATDEEGTNGFNFDYGNIDIVRVFPMEDYRNTDPDRKQKEYDLGILYIKKDDGTLLEDEEAVFKYIPDKTDGILTREVKPTLVKPANVMGLEEIYEEDDDEEITDDEVISS